jgi:PAS domain S-box-containing protein
MIEPQPHPNEAARLAVLDSYQVLDSASEEVFDAITRTAALICGMPIATITLVDRDRQWFKSVFGLEGTEGPRATSFCGHTIHGEAILEINDALDDPRFFDNPAVTGPPSIRYYAGMPLVGVEGLPLGTLCVADRAPRHLNDMQRATLSQLSTVVISLLTQRKAEAEATRRLNAVVALQSRLADADLDLDAFLGLVLSELGPGSGAASAILTVTEGDDQIVHAASGLHESAIGRRLRGGGSLCGLAVATAEILITEDCRTDPRVDREALARAGALSAAAVPLLREGVAFGAVMLLAPRIGAFGESDRQNFRLIAGLLSAAFEHRLRVDRNLTLLAERSTTLDLLAEVNERFRTAMVYSPNGMALLAPGGRWIEVNDAFCRLLGYSAEELIERSFLELTHPDDIGAGIDSIARIASAEIDFYRAEKRYIRKDGSAVWCLLATSAVRNSDGSLKYVISQVTDIDQQKRAEEALLHASQRLNETNRLLMMGEELAQLGHWYLSVGTGEIRWSDEIFRIHGREIDLGPPALEAALDFYHPDDRPVIAGLVFEAMATGTAFACELRLIRPDGSIRDVSSRGQADRAADGAITGLFGVFQDITERKHNALRMAQEADRYRTLMMTAKDGIHVLDETGRLREANDAFLAMLGYSPEEAATLNRRDWAVGDARFRDLAMSPRTVETQMCRKDGSIIDVEISAHPIQLDDRPYLYAAARDITQRKAAQRVLEQARDALVEARDRAEAANRAKSEFLAMMSHEIRTPMNGVIGMNGLLLETELTPQQRKLAETVRYSAGALLTIIDDILDLSKLEADKISLEEVGFDFRVLIEQAAELMAPRAAEKGIALSVSISDRGTAWFRGDPTRMRQIVLNLVGNAIKFTDQGSVVIDMRVGPAGQDRAAIRLEVRDTGIGIGDAAKKTLFRPFEQADASITRRFGGTGLGLSICKRLIELMGGSIGVTDRVGGGSIFWIEVTLPRAGQIADAARPATTDNGERPSAGRILLAEDNPINVELARLILEGFGYTVTVAADGVEAVAAIRDHEFDLVLMDVQMPKLDGLSATKQIRAAEGSKRRLPIIAMTANAMKEDHRLCLEAGMDDYVPKPIDKDKLRQTLALWIGQEHRAAQGAASVVPAPVAALPVIDQAKLDLLRQLFKDERFFPFLRLYLKEAAAQTERLKRFHAAMAISDIQREAHDLVASAGNIGARHLQELGNQLHLACRASDIPAIGTLLAAVLDASTAASAVIQRVAEALPETAANPLRQRIG